MTMKKQRKRGRIWEWLYMALLGVFTVYALLDTFVITKVYAAAGTAAAGAETADTVSSDTEETDDGDTAGDAGVAAGDDSGTVADAGDTAGDTDAAAADDTSDSTQTEEAGTVIGTYSQDGVSITVKEYRVSDTSVYVADVTLASADSLQSAFADDTYGKNVTETTSSIASAAGAVLAINGDFYGAQESGYVIRNGVLYRDTASADSEDLVIYKDGTFGIENESDVTAQELLDNGAEQVLSFGPALVEDGSVSVTQNEEVGKAKASNPRTAIGVIDSLHYEFVVSDGRTSESTGLSLYQLAEFMESLGCTTAYNLDGGGSSTMYFNGEVINQPTTNGRTIAERKVSDVLYVK
jgi:exopolysaccharide biosynthesis protein